MSLKAECATLEVPENPSGEGRRITLSIVRVPAISERKAADPLFILAGGPGMGAQEMYPAVAAAFSRVGRDRDIILLDQRGTGTSTPLACALDPDGALLRGKEATVEDIDAAARDCLDELRAKHDVRQYTTSVAVRDLETVREALGAERINLYGGSYGTRVAQQYAKTFPQHTRAVVIDSVAPMSLVLGSEHAKNLDATLDAQFARCAADAACAKAVPDARAALAQVRDALSQPGLAPVAYRDPTTGERREEVPALGHLTIALRLYSYSPLTATLLPVVLKQAADGDYAPLLAQSRFLMGSFGESIMHGMQLSVICTEDADEMQPDPADAETVMGAEFVAFTQAQCAVWPRGQRPADFRAPLTGDVPVLAISGEFDPVTPPRYGDAAIAQLPNARHLVLKGQGHTPINEGCMPKLFAQFIETADAKGLDAACLERLAPLPPGTGLHGWEP